MNQYLFLRRQNLKPRRPKVVVERKRVLAAIDWITSREPLPVHVDLETVGLDSYKKERVITNVGLSSSEWLIGLSLIHLTPEEAFPLWEWLAECEMSGFNLPFDLSWPWGKDVEDLKIGMDVNIMFRALATEKWVGQRHDVETLVTDILGWPEEDFQKDWLKYVIERHNLRKDKGDMWKLSYLEPEGYTYYCAMDAEASYQGEIYFRQVIEEKGFNLAKWNNFVWNDKIKRVIRMRYDGITVDQDLIRENYQLASLYLAGLKDKILNHPQVKSFYEEWEQKELLKTYQFRVSKRKIKAKAKDEPWKDLDTWQLELVTDKDQFSKLPKSFQLYGGNFVRHEPKFDLKGKKNPLPKFNLNSDDLRKELIYNHWLTPETYEIVTHKDNPKKGIVKITWDEKTYEVDLTPTGGLPSSGDVLVIFGEIGSMINSWLEVEKLRGDFLLKYRYISMSTGRVHPTLKIHGANTGRATAGKDTKGFKVPKPKEKLDGSAWDEALLGGEE